VALKAHRAEPARYDHGEVEPRWQRFWHEHATFRAVRRPGREKRYVLVEALRFNTAISGMMELLNHLSDLPDPLPREGVHGHARPSGLAHLGRGALPGGHGRDRRPGQRPSPRTRGAAAHGLRGGGAHGGSRCRRGRAARGGPDSQKVRLRAGQDRQRRRRLAAWTSRMDRRRTALLEPDGHLCRQVVAGRDLKKRCGQAVSQGADF